MENHTKRNTNNSKQTTIQSPVIKAKSLHQNNQLLQFKHHKSRNYALAMAKTPNSLPLIKKSNSKSAKFTESMKQMVKVLQECPVNSSEELRRLRSIEKIVASRTTISLHNQKDRSLSKTLQHEHQRHSNVNLCEREQSTAYQLNHSKMALVQQHQEAAHHKIDYHQPMKIASSSSSESQQHHHRQHRLYRPSNDILRPGPGILERAQKAKQTLFGLKIMQGTFETILTKAKLDRMRRDPHTNEKYRSLLSEPYNQMSIISEHLGLTGAFGITKEHLCLFQHPVRCFINVTYELPLLRQNDCESYRVPVDDVKEEDLSRYFDDVTDKIEQMHRRNSVTIVHCMAGVSRSASFVIAYLIRFNRMTLKEAFEHTKQARPCINPNISFLRQLHEFEWKCLHDQHINNKQLTKMIKHSKNGIEKELPDFIIENYLDDYQCEFELE